MDFNLSQEQKLLVDAVRKMAETEFRPRARAIDEEERFPWENVKLLAEAGLMGLSIPEEYGGSGCGVFEVVLTLENIAKVCLNTAGVIALHCGACSRAITKYGSGNLKRRFLPLMAEGKILAAYAQTEPNAGSDVGSIKTKAKLEGDHFVVNGRKAFISNAQEASIFVTIVRLGEKTGTNGIGCLVIEKDSPGLSVGKNEKKLGFRGTSLCEVMFDDCIVPRENLLVGEGGYKNMLKAFNAERCGNAALALGVAEGALDEAVRYAKERVQFGKRIREFQGIQWMLAEMKMKVDAAQMLLYRAAANAAAGLPNMLETSVAKVVANQAACEVTDMALQIHGGYGYLRDYAVERMLRDARFPQLGGGTIQIQKNNIARELLRD